jgi:hypothetical protein
MQPSHANTLPLITQPAFSCHRTFAHQVFSIRNSLLLPGSFNLVNSCLAFIQCQVKCQFLRESFFLTQTRTVRLPPNSFHFNSINYNGH